MNNTIKVSISAAIICSLFCLIFLSGCGKQAVSNKNKEITFLFQGTPEQIKLFKDKMIPLFEKRNPGIEVKLLLVTGGSNVDKLMTMMAAGTPPDVMYLQDTALPNFVAKGVLLNLNEFAKEDKEFNISDFYPAGIKLGSIDGKLYLVPRVTGVVVVFYNKKLFDEAHIPYPEKDWKWDDLYKIGKALTRDINNDARIDQWGIAGLDNIVAWTNLINQNGGSLFNKDKTKCLIDSPEAIEAVEFFKKLFDSKALVSTYNLSTSGLGGMELAQAFASGRVAMVFSDVGYLANYLKTMSWGVVEPPMQKKKASHAGSLGYTVSSKTKYPGESWKLVKFLVSPEFMREMIGKDVGYPSRKSVSKEFFSRFFGQNADIDVFENTMKYGIYEQQLEKFSECLTYLIEIMDVASGAKKGDIPSTCKQVSKKITVLLNKK